jgi:hypothetical protein
VSGNFAPNYGAIKKRLSVQDCAEKNKNKMKSSHEDPLSGQVKPDTTNQGERLFVFTKARLRRIYIVDVSLTKTQA